MNNNPRKNRKRKLDSGVVRYVDHSIAIAKQINIILKKLNKNQSDLASALGKKESEISKWLRGSHNFTLKTISKIEDALGEPIIVCPKDTQTEIIVLSFMPDQYVLLKDIELKVATKVNPQDLEYSNFVASSSSEKEITISSCTATMN